MQSLSEHYFAPYWREHGIAAANIEHAEQWAKRSAKYACAGSWRAKVIKGQLWVKMLKVEPHWSEQTSVLQLLRMALRGTVGDVDVVYIHSDRDPNVHLIKASCPSCVHHMLPLLGNAHATPSNTLPVPDYSWGGWAAHTPPWCERFRSMASAGSSLPFKSRADRAFFSGEAVVRSAPRHCEGLRTCPSHHRRSPPRRSTDGQRAHHAEDGIALEFGKKTQYI